MAQAAKIDAYGKLKPSTRGARGSLGPVSFGTDALDQALHGGLARAAVHEVFAAQPVDTAAALGFALALLIRAGQALPGKVCSSFPARSATQQETRVVRRSYSDPNDPRTKPLLIVCQDVLDHEMGHLNAPGLRDFGLTPERILLVKAQGIDSVLRAGEQGARCAGLGGVLMMSWGNPKSLNLTASRRLTLAAEKSGVPLFLLRAGGVPEPSAAATRWSVAAAKSRAFPADAPGHPSFVLNLLRHRGGVESSTWSVEWNRELTRFEISNSAGSRDTPLPRTVVSLSRGQQVAPFRHRKTG